MLFHVSYGAIAVIEIFGDLISVLCAVIKIVGKLKVF